VTGRVVVCHHARMRGCYAQLFGWACRVEPKQVGTAIRENDWPRMSCSLNSRANRRTARVE
jgi:hypothetical protein